MSELTMETHRTNAVLTNYGGDENGTPCVIFHAALGTMNCFRLLIKHFLHQNTGPVIGVTVADVKAYCALDTETLVKEIAADYARQLAATGYDKFQLVGYCLGGLTAVEVGSCLMEMDLEVADLVLVDSMPLLFDIDDDLMLESLFTPNLNISFEDAVAAAGFGRIRPEDTGRGILKVFNDNHMRIPAGGMADLGGDEALDRVGEVFARLSRLTSTERFEVYLKQIPEYGDGEILLSVEMAESLFRMYAQSTRAARFPLSPYHGDIRYLKAREEIGLFPGMGERVMAFWQETCRGDFRVYEIDGNHLTCSEVEPFATQLAQEIGKPFMAA